MLDVKVIVARVVGAYQGVSRRTLDWNLWMRWMLAGWAEPHNSTIALDLVLHIFILFLMESFDELVMSGQRRSPNSLLWSISGYEGSRLGAYLGIDPDSGCG